MFRRIARWVKNLFKKKEVTREMTPTVSPPDMVTEFTPLKYIEHYRNLWSSMVIREEKKSTIAWYVNMIKKNEARYKEVAAVSLVPWEVIGAIHLLESGGSFEGVLHNGDKIIGTGRKTYRVPKNRGPFNSWLEAAIDALSIKKQPEIWNVENTLYYMERYNGLGYLRDSRKPHSPYLWSFSKHYARGKYIFDDRYSSTAVSKQCGVAVILKELGFKFK